MKFLPIFLLLWLPAGAAPTATEGTPPFTAHYQTTDYQEPYRPQFHFSPQNEWMNDINALWYLDGVWHMTYQWGKAIRHAGYASSPDLLHWNDHGVILIPQDSHIKGSGAVPNIKAAQVYSGSGVVVSGATAEKITGSTDTALVTLYTGTKVGTCIAWSNDQGKTWHDFPGNPVANPTDNDDPRDPCVFRYEPDQCWIMAIYEKGTTFYRSDDLINWKKVGNVEFGFECPDVFQLPVDGNPVDLRWVLADASGKYLVGNFNGKTFTPEQAVLPMDHGPDFYAAQTFFPGNLPGGKGIQLAWMDHWNGGIGEKVWERNATFPVELGLVKEGDKILLTRNPIPAIKSLYRNSVTLENTRIVSGAADQNPGLLKDARSKAFELTVEIDLEKSTAQELAFQLNDRLLRIDLKKHALMGIEKPKRGAETERAITIPRSQDKLLKIRILVDWSCLEVFAQEGRFSYTEQYGFSPENDQVGLKAVDGAVEIRSLEWHDLKSIWPPAGVRKK
jgi:fructan beta-fructosidase